MIDLHAHTTASDGQHSPTEVVELARQAGVRTLAITDHDTCAGLEEAGRAAQAAGIEFVPGIELSSFLNGRELHLLGHFVDKCEETLSGLSALLRAEREKRMHKMIERLGQLGLVCPFEEVVRVSSGKNLGRPHLARVMVERGYVKDVKEAFDRYIGSGRPAYFDRYRLQSEDAIAMVRRAGGVATVAHPAVNHVDRAELRELKRQGLDGLEVAHSDHSPDVRARLMRIAKEFDLVPTAGSDFHGDLISPGRILGSMSMDPNDLARLRARATGREATIDAV